MCRYITVLVPLFTSVSLENTARRTFGDEMAITSIWRRGGGGGGGGE
jgi:hypothetical protein